MSQRVKNSMGDSTGTRRALRFSPLIWLVALGACTSVLGVEDLHEGPRPGSAGDTSSGNVGNESTIGGKTNTTGGKSGTAGSSNPDGGVGNEPTGGKSATAGSAPMGGDTSDAGDTSMGGAIEPAGGTVKGKVVDRWGLPVGNITVQIGETQVSTDDKGAFTVEDVGPTFDVSLLVLGDGWVYQDVTRRDPTLQVFQGHASHDTYVNITSDKAVLGVNDQLSLAAGTPTGSREYADIGVDSPVSFYPEWEGGTTTASTMHGLLWTQNAATKLPASYKAYDFKQVALAAGVDVSVTLNLAAKAITSMPITGTVTPRTTPIGDGSRTNGVFVRFNSGASIQVVDHEPTLDAFSYIVPNLANSSLTLAAWEGSFYGPLGMIHKDGLSPGGATGTLAIPAPPSQLTPPYGATNVDENASFSFKASPDNAGAFIVIIHSLDTNKHLYIVTTHQKLTKLPSVVDGAWVLEHGTGAATPAEYEWWIETHGSFATVDAMTGSDGYFDEFGVNYTSPVAAHQQDGSYTYTPAYSFTTKNQ